MEAIKVPGGLSSATENAWVQDFEKQLDGDMVEISISHEKDYAIATALFC